MRAVLLRHPGGPEVLEVVEVPDPGPPGPRELLVALRAAGVNPIDTKLRARGTYFPDRGPAILGCDGAGVVIAAGDRTTRFRPGDAVYFFNGGIGDAPGTYAEATLVDERFCAPRPRALDWHRAAAAPLALITAWESLHDHGAIAAGAQVLIHAGAGGVGHLAVQLAALAGARVCTTVSTPAKGDLAARLGADEIIPYRERDFVAATRHCTGGRGADLVLDTVGGETFRRSIDATRLYGRLVTLLQPAAAEDLKAARLRSLAVALELMLAPMYFGDLAERERQTRILERGAELFDSGRLEVVVDRVLPLEAAADAHRLLESGAVTGKLVLEISRDA